jgi:hypothetical protein
MTPSPTGQGTPDIDSNGLITPANPVQGATDTSYDSGFDPTPTAVTLAAFDAAPQGGSILISWETGTELDNLGFNLHRSEVADGERVRLNAALIPSQNSGSPLGASYQFVDETAEAGITYYYWLEAVDLYGVAKVHGPVSAPIPADQIHRIFMPSVRK